MGLKQELERELVGIARPDLWSEIERRAALAGPTEFPAPDSRPDGLPRDRLVAAAVAILVILGAIAILWSAFRPAPPGPANRPVPSPTPKGVGFVGLPPEGAQASIRPSGGLVLDFHGLGSPGVQVDLYVYADGTMIWQKSSYQSVPVGVPEGANRFTSGYLEQRLTPQGVELLRSKIFSTGLFEHQLDLRAENLQSPLWMRVRRGDGAIIVSASRASGPPRAKATPAQARALERIQVLLADPGAWLPATAWVDREIRAFVASRYSGGFDRRVPSRSEFPPLVAELLFDRPHCRDFTVEEVRMISKALEDEGIAPSQAPDGQLAFEIYLPGDSYAAYLHFWPVIPDRAAFEGWGKGVGPRC